MKQDLQFISLNNSPSFCKDQSAGNKIFNTNVGQKENGQFIITLSRLDSVKIDDHPDIHLTPDDNFSELLLSNPNPNST